jgi:hypothetical protein
MRIPGRRQAPGDNVASVTAQACQHHPEEAALGICVVCGAALCDACITKVDGINHCRSCLLARAARAVPPAPRRLSQLGASLSWLSVAAGVLVLAALALRTLNALAPSGAP